MRPSNLTGSTFIINNLGTYIESKRVFNNVDRREEDGVKVEHEHKLDTQSIPY